MTLPFNVIPETRRGFEHLTFQQQQQQPYAMTASSSESAASQLIASIYDALDSGNLNGALSLSIKARSRFPASLLAMSLHALSLFRVSLATASSNLPSSSSHEKQALEICDQIIQTHTSHPHVLHIVSLVYGHKSMHNQLIAMYGNAYTGALKNVSLVPGSLKAQANAEAEELGIQWFMAMIRAGQWKGAQSSVLQVQKSFPNTKYSFWNMVLVYLQYLNASSSAPGLGQGEKSTTNPKLLATLLERQLRKALSENKITHAEQLFFAVSVMDRLIVDECKERGCDQSSDSVAISKYRDLLTWISPIANDANTTSSTSSLFKVKVEELQWCVRYALLGQNWKLVNTCSHGILESHDADDWSAHLAFIQSSIALGKITQYSSFILKLQQKIDKDKKRVCRGPWIAQLKWAVDTQESSSVIDPLLRKFYDKFGYLHCCFEDMKPFLSSGSTEFTDFIMKTTSTPSIVAPNGSSPSVADAKKLIQCRVNAEKIKRYLSHKSSDPRHLVRLYVESLPYGRDLVATELQFGDEFLLLAAHGCLDTFEPNEPQHIALATQLACLLHIGLVSSPANYQLKILLTRIYMHLGVQSRPATFFKELEIKQIQLDTLSHLFFGEIEYLSVGDASTSLDPFKLTRQQLTIHQSNERETPEMIVHAFRYDTLSKVEEFVRFRDRLRYSVQRIVANLQLARLQILHHAHDYPAMCKSLLATSTEASSILEVSSMPLSQCTEAFYSKLYDNRDSTIASQWDTNPLPVYGRLQGSKGPGMPMPRQTWIAQGSALLYALQAMAQLDVEKWQAAVPIVAGISGDWRRAGDIVSAFLAVFSSSGNEGDTVDEDMALDGLNRAVKAIFVDWTDYTPVPDFLNLNVLMRLTHLMEALSIAYLSLRAWISNPSSKVSSAKSLTKSSSPCHIALRHVLRTLHGELVRFESYLKDYQTKLQGFFDGPESLLTAHSNPNLPTDYFGTGDWMDDLWCSQPTSKREELQRSVCESITQSWKGSLHFMQRRVAALLHAEYLDAVKKWPDSFV